MLQGSGIFLFSPFVRVIPQLPAFAIIYMRRVLLGATWHLRPASQQDVKIVHVQRIACLAAEPLPV